MRDSDGNESSSEHDATHYTGQELALDTSDHQKTRASSDDGLAFDQPLMRMDAHENPHRDQDAH
jgi:hypothetical protein